MEAIQKVGMDKLKPIKEELPEEISYFMIKVAIMLEKETNKFEINKNDL